MTHNPSQPQNPPQEPKRGSGFVKSFKQSNWITDGWNWFMVFAGKAAEPVLILSVLYSSAKLLPALQPYLNAQLDAAVFIAQFIALDVGGLSLNKMANLVQETNPKGAKQAKWLSIALVVIMIAGVILASLSPIMAKAPQLSSGIDTTLLIFRAILAVLYSRVIHTLKTDEQPGPSNGTPAPAPAFSSADIQEIVRKELEAQAAHYEERLADMTANHNQHINLLQVQQSTALSQLREEQERTLRNLSRRSVSEEKPIGGTPANGTPTNGTRQLPPANGTKQLGTGASGTRQLPPTGGISSLPEQPSNVVMMHKAATSANASANTTSATSGERTAAEIATDNVVWPLLDAGKTVRAIEAESNISKSVVARSRQRWSVARGTAAAGTNDLSQEAEDENRTTDSGTNNLSQEQSA